MLTTPAKLTSYPFNIGANKLLVNRANIRKHYTEILIAVRNGMRLKTSNNLIAVICVCWVLQLKKPCSTWIHWEPANLRSRCLLSRILFSISYFSHLSWRRLTAVVEKIIGHWDYIKTNDRLLSFGINFNGWLRTKDGNFQFRMFKAAPAFFPFSPSLSSVA